MEKKDLRKYPRTSADFTVQFTVGGKIYREHAEAFGGGGLFLALKHSPPLALGMELKLSFRPAKHLPVFEVEAKVSYLLPGESAGLEFTAIDAEQRGILLHLIHGKTRSRRKFSRARFATQIDCNECMSLAFSRDVSVGGMFVETNEPLPIGSSLTLRFSVDQQEEIMAIKGEVVYHAGKLGMGVQFSEVSADTRKRLETYVANCARFSPAPIEG